MNWIFIILGFAVLLGVLLWYIFDMKKKYTQEEIDFENPKQK